MYSKCYSSPRWEVEPQVTCQDNHYLGKKKKLGTWTQIWEGGVEVDVVVDMIKFNQAIELNFFKIKNQANFREFDTNWTKIRNWSRS